MLKLSTMAMHRIEASTRAITAQDIVNAEEDAEYEAFLTHTDDGSEWNYEKYGPPGEEWQFIENVKNLMPEDLREGVEDIVYPKAFSDVRKGGPEVESYFWERLEAHGDAMSLYDLRELVGSLPYLEFQSGEQTHNV